MPSELAGDTCIGEHSACLLRAAKLGPDCAPVGGDNSGIVTVGIVTATATPEYRDTRRIEPTNGCGDVMFTFEQVGCLLRETLTGELIFHDFEMMEVLFGGTLIVGEEGSDCAGKVIGWSKPSCPEEVPGSVYLEIIVQAASQDFGECAPEIGGCQVAYVGHIFGKAQLTPGAQTYADSEITVPFDGFSTRNPNLAKGPWQDYPGEGPIPVGPHHEVGYSHAQYEAILAQARCGYQDLPAVYS